jgi:hypothetical protein
MPMSEVIYTPQSDLYKKSLDDSDRSGTERNIQKPPLGLTPKWIIDEHRMQDIHEAIMRYNQAHKEIPSEWIQEYISLCNV